ncbi:MAG: hypothetical protein JO326_02005 [Acetobacteraceae bacterium]|nr:hypothetical protein [Acetobacteraceae bacterium]
MTELPADSMMVHLTVDDARTAQEAGARFARTLAGACPEDFALALAAQTDLIERAITDAGYSDQQARLAAGHFEVAARDEWQRIVDASGSEPWGTA